MSTIRKSLLHALFSGFSMRRWNDKLRTTELYEIDKQAHKMIIAFLLAHSVKCEDEEQKIDLLYDIIEHALFDYFYRLVTTDLKPPLFYKIQENKQHAEELTLYVEKKLEPILLALPQDFFLKFKAYHRGEKKASHPLTSNILKAAHLFASQWEFNLIKDHNSFDSEIPKIDADFKKQLKSLAQKNGLEELNHILDKENALGAFAHFCGQLRFQVRWSQEQRLPLTTVLGHMFFVASLSYFISLDIKACKARIVNNFFCGLFHDLPELLTRDIISPVKNSSKELPQFIKQYEYDELQQRILYPLENAGYSHIVEPLSYLLGLEIDGEFNACYMDKAKIIACTFSELQEHNTNIYSPKDGSIIKACDVLAAFMEAHTSIRLGVSSEEIIAFCVRMRINIPNPAPQLIDFKALLADFD